MSDSISSASLTPPDGTQRRRQGRVTALLILAICAAPTIAALVAYYFWHPAGRMNYGELIEPGPLPPMALVRLDGRPFALAELKGKWVMVQLDDAWCEAACQKKLFNMRQVRLAQGRDMERIERVWLLPDNGMLSAELGRLTDGVLLARAQGATGVPFPAATNVRDYIYLVDPLGNLMLRFPKDADPRRMIKDLQRLLKVSRIG